MSGFWFGSDDQTRSSSSEMPADTTDGERVALDRAACGLFFNQDPVPAAVNNAAAAPDARPISLDATPQDNLLKAISYDLDGDYEDARRLYVWLTASSPDVKIDLDCGHGIHLSGSITSLAQRRLAALDTSKPQFARSEEIETAVATATVAPGPDLPNPPQVKRNLDFYKQGGVVDAEPEDRTSFSPRMDMPVSENTARLTSVDKRGTSPSEAANVAEPVIPEPKPSEAVVAAPTPTEAAPEATKAAEPEPASPSGYSGPADEMTAPSIAGSQEGTNHSGVVVQTNSRPIEQGTLEIDEDAPATTMIEVPMASKAAPEAATAEPVATAAPAQQPAPQAAAAVAPNAPYYTVQLAAYRSRERAEAAWPKFQSRSNGVLSSAAHEVTTIVIDGKGLFFRLMTGQYAGKSDASQACSTLKAQGVDCLIRRVTP
ncbi:SPOR domain-containing protein [Thalassospira lucentensis]|uniref:SPOR domain-containing protein n=1 Tax=Thalassospira lucentensis TaxID=168935 RepID=UPI00142E8733|nr:SPOR domain-containing protein [Thalassospira lucentensis]